MDLKKIEEEIRKKIESRHHSFQARADWYTPSGNRRSIPMYEVEVENEYLSLSKLIRSRCACELEAKATKQLQQWEEQEVKQRLQKAKNIKEERIKLENEYLEQEREALANILKATLKVDDKIDWEGMKDRTTFPSHSKFSFNKKEPIKPEEPIPNFFQRRIPVLFKKKLNKYQDDLKDWEQQTTLWKQEKEKARKNHEKAKNSFYNNQDVQNKSIDQFKRNFEAEEPDAIIEYMNAVFERSDYPDSFYVEYRSDYDAPSKTLVVDISLPSQDKLSKVDFKYQKSNNTIKEVLLKDKEHNAIYDQAIKQCVLRTIHEIFESIYTNAVQSVVVNAWVEYVDPSTGNDKISCILSVLATKEEFEKINLEKVDIDTCIKGLKGLIAGPLSDLAPVKPILQLNSDLAPVKPILQLNREDERFIESCEQLADLNSATNLVEMHWENFEHLVGELFSKMFSSEGTEVKVTQSSHDGGIDAIAFDPDPIRGGKFVIQAKRYTNTVSVSAVRDLYGTMINEGAVKGILVTTSYYGRESREFAKDKPISLIDGSNLVYLLEEYGYKVRIDLKETKERKQEKNE